MNANTSKKITIVSFVLSILIIVAHTYNVAVYNLTNGIVFWFERIVDSTTEPAVPLFFLLSSFLFYYDIDEKGYIYKLKRRLKSLVIPFVVWNIIGLIYYFVLSKIPFVKEYISLDINIPLSKILLNIISTEYNKPLWFLQYLIIYTYLTTLLKNILRNKKISFIFIVIYYVLIIFNVISKNSLYVDYIYYLIGAYVGLHNKEIVIRRYTKKTIIISLIIFIICASLFIFTDITSYASINCIRMLVEASSMWVLFDILICVKEIKQYMKITFFSYAIHEMILEPIEKVIFIVLGNNQFGALIDYIFAPICCFMIILLVSLVLRKNKTLWLILSGSR